MATHIKLLSRIIHFKLIDFNEKHKIGTKSGDDNKHNYSRFNSISFKNID